MGTALKTRCKDKGGEDCKNLFEVIHKSTGKKTNTLKFKNLSLNNLPVHTETRKEVGEECQSRFVDDSKTYKKYSLDEKSCVDKTHNEDEDCAENDPKRTVNWGLSIGEKDKLVTQVNVGLPLRYLIKLGETGSIIAKTSILHQVLKLKDISEAIGSYLSDTYLGQKKTASNENALMTAQGWTIAVFHIFIVDAVRRTRKWKEDAMDEDESGKADPGERKRKLLDEALKNFKDLKNDFYEVEAPDSDFPDPAFCIDKGANFISQTIDEDEELKEL